MGFIVKVVLALAVAAGLVWGYTVLMPKNTQVAETASDSSQTGQQPSNEGGISVSGSSDSALQADLRSIDTQVDAAQSAQADTDASANDKPVPQTE